MGEVWGILKVLFSFQTQGYIVAQLADHLPLKHFTATDYSMILNLNTL